MTWVRMKMMKMMITLMTAMSNIMPCLTSTSIVVDIIICITSAVCLALLAKLVPNNVTICVVMILFPDNDINDTSQQMEFEDYDIDIFLIFEELEAVDGKPPPTSRKDLCEFLHDKRKPFIKCYHHVIAVNLTAQVCLARDQHNTVHSGLLWPTIKPFLQAITSLGFGHMYYGASIHTHANQFLQIWNGHAVTQLKSYRQLDLKIPMSRVNPSVVGQHWNSRYTWGVVSLNIKQSGPHDIVNCLTIKPANVTNGILPQFVVCQTFCWRLTRTTSSTVGWQWAMNDGSIMHSVSWMRTF
jgi:hypothetical protein